MNITNQYNISLYNISNSSKNDNHIYNRFKHNYGLALLLLIFIMYSPALIPLFGLLKELIYEIFSPIYKLLFNRLNRNNFMIEMGSMEHKITNEHSNTQEE